MKRLLILGFCLLVALPTFAASDERPSPESVKQLLEATGSRKLMDSMLNQMDASMQRGIEESLKGKYVSPAQQAIIDDMRAKFVTLMRQELTWDTVEPLIVDVYQRTFTQEEVSGMLAFYRSKVGKSMAAKMPQVMAASSQLMQSRMSTLIPKIQDLQRNTLHKLEASEVLQDPSGQAEPSTPASQP